LPISLEKINSKRKITAMATNHLLEMKQCGQSIWMDNLTRDIIQSGELKNLVENQGISGITSNPAIFEKAIAGNVIYDADIEAGIRAGLPTYKIYESLTFADIRNACDILRPVYEATNKLDGYVSIEVPPTIAHDTQATIAEAQRYFPEIGAENVMIKIPGTEAGLPAVEQSIADGINVNITLLFSVNSYINSAWAYIRGLEKRVAQSEDISKIASIGAGGWGHNDRSVHRWGHNDRSVHRWGHNDRSVHRWGLGRIITPNSQCPMPHAPCPITNHQSPIQNPKSKI
jgi:transaldolase